MTHKLRVLILGGSGMLGHKLWQTCQNRFETFVTVRQPFANFEHYGIFDRARIIDHVNATELTTVVSAVDLARPDVVVNCIGIVKQDPLARDPVQSIAVNALFPHQMAQTCRDVGARLIQISTDCVFTGSTGNYNEDDKTDADDLYGRTKLLGEVTDSRCLTVRTSMIGRELCGQHGLLEWFLSEAGKQVRGFRRAIFSGMTTNALSALIANLISTHRDLEGLFHVAAEPISKFDLLQLIKQIYGLEVDIEPDDSLVCDRSLDGSRFVAATGFVAPTWSKMISELHSDSTHYTPIRSAELQR